MYDIQENCEYGYEDEHEKYQKYSGCEKEIDYPEEPKYRNIYSNKEIELNNKNTKKIIINDLNEYYKDFLERRILYDQNIKKEKASIYIQKKWRGYIYRKDIVYKYDKYLYNNKKKINEIINNIINIIV